MIKINKIYFKKIKNLFQKMKKNKNNYSAYNFKNKLKIYGIKALRKVNNQLMNLKLAIIKTNQ